MPKMIVSIDGVVIKEVQLTKDRTSPGPAGLTTTSSSTTWPSAGNTPFCRCPVMKFLSRI